MRCVAALLVVVGGCAADAGAAAGEEVWLIEHGGAGALVDRALAVAPLGTGVVAGGYESIDADHVAAWLWHLTPEGDVETTAEDAGVVVLDRWISDVATAPDGGVLAVGGASTDPEQTDAWIQAMDGDLQPLWTRTWAGAAGGPDEAVGVAVDDDGTILVVGYEAQTGSDTDLVVRLLDPGGAELWSDRHAGAAMGFDAALEATFWDGDPLVVGYVSEGPAANETDIWVRRYDRAGAPRWTFAPARVGIDRANAVAVLQTGDLLVGGFVCEPGHALDAWLARLTPGGQVSWEQTRDGPGGFADSVASLAAAPDGGWITAGFVFVEGEDFDVWTERVDAAGDPLWSRLDSGRGGGDDQAAAVAITADESVWIAGSVTVSGSGANADIDGFVRRVAP